MTHTVNPVWVQGHGQFKLDNNTMALASVLGAEDTNTNVARDVNFRLRMSWGESAGQTTSTSSGTITLQFAINGGSFTTVGASTAVQYATSAVHSDGTTETTSRLTGPTGVGSFAGICEHDSNNSVGAATLVSQWREVEFTLKMDSAQVSASDTVTFRLLHGGATFDSTDATPTLTATDVAPAWIAGHFRFGNDDGTMSTRTWKAAEDTNITASPGDVVRLRMNYGESALQNTQTASGVIHLYYRVNGGSWAICNDGTSDVALTSSTHVTDGTTESTERLSTSPTDVASFGGYAEFNSLGSTASRTPVDWCDEVEFNVLIKTGVGFANGDEIEFSLRHGGAAFTSNDTIPKITLEVGTTLLPGSGSVFLTGYAPAIAQGKTLTPTTASVSWTGHAPSIEQPVATVVEPGAGHVTLTGHAATIAQAKAIEPGAGAVTVSGQVPTIAQGKAIEPGSGSITIGGQQPAIAQAKTIEPGAGSVTLTGHQPGVSAGGGQELQPGPGSVILTGYAPSIVQGKAIEPGAGSVKIVGHAPTIGQARELVPGVGSVLVTGYAPDVVQVVPTIVEPGSGSVILTGYAATIVQGVVVAPGSGSVRYAGHRPGVAQGSGGGGGSVVFLRRRVGIRLGI